MIPPKAIENAVAVILESIGEDTHREGLQGTPRRVAELYCDLFSGINKDPAAELSITYDEEFRGLILLRDIPFHSMCEHHLLPFFGIAHVGYKPRGRIVGAGKLVRALEVLARRPQLQERLTDQLANVIFDTLEAEGVVVVIKAEHLCLSLRETQKPGTQVVTTATRGTIGEETLLSVLQCT